MNRYFRGVYRSNREKNRGLDYKLKKQHNPMLVVWFFDTILEFFKYSYRQDKEDRKKLLENLRRTLSNYDYSVRVSDRNNYVSMKAGRFGYKLFKELVTDFNNVTVEEDYSIRYELRDIYGHLVGRFNGTDSFAYYSFIECLKRKIIDHRTPNSKGFYPAMLLIYFYLYDWTIFSGSADKHENRILHIPILKKLSEALPRLHQGFIRSFYDKTSLPTGKEEKLAEKGQKIINDFLRNPLEYDFATNSLIYSYDEEIDATKINLDDFEKDEEILREEI